MSDSPCLRTWKGGCAASHAHPATKERRRGGVRSLATVGRAFECLSSLYWPSLPPNADNYSLLLWAMVVGGLRMAATAVLESGWAGCTQRARPSTRKQTGSGTFEPCHEPTRAPAALQQCSSRRSSV